MARLAHRHIRAYDSLWTASEALDAVESWISDCVLLRETGCFRNGRLDGLIIPTSWNAPVKAGFYGVEVKMDRGDFLKGLNSGQFDRYAESVNGLYIVTPAQGVAKTSEIPKHFGHLAVASRHEGRGYGYRKVCVCKRHPKRREVQYEAATFWSIWWDLFDQIHRKTMQNYKTHEQWKKRIGEEIVSRFMKLARECENKADNLKNERDGG